MNCTGGTIRYPVSRGGRCGTGCRTRGACLAVGHLSGRTADKLLQSCLRRPGRTGLALSTARGHQCQQKNQALDRPDRTHSALRSMFLDGGL